MRRRSIVLVLSLGVALAGCSGDGSTTADADGAPAEEQADTGAEASGDEEAADDAGGTDDSAEDAGAAPAGEAGVLIQFRGEQLTAGPDTELWACVTAPSQDFASVMFLDEAGNDVSITHDGGSRTQVTLTLADGTNWNVTPDGVVNVMLQDDGAASMSIQLTETDTGETESMDVRLTC